MTRKDPSYRLHKTSGRAVCTINGKDFYLGRFGSKESKAAYKRLIQEWKATGKCNCYGASKPAVTLAMLMVDYLEHCEKHYPHTYNSQTKQTRIALRYLADYQDCQRHQKAAGILCRGIESIKTIADQGFTEIAVESYLSILRQAYQEIQAAVRIKS